MRAVMPMSGHSPTAYVVSVNEAQWDEVLMQLTKAADSVAVLSRCLAMQPHLMRWKVDGNQLEGQLAADALDQARGDLERLAEGGAARLASLVEGLLEVLPVPLE